MFDFASSEVWRRSTSFLREVVWADRVPAAKRAMNSFNCAIFFSRWAFWQFWCGLPWPRQDGIGNFGLHMRGWFVLCSLPPTLVG